MCQAQSQRQVSVVRDIGIIPILTTGACILSTCSSQAVTRENGIQSPMSSFSLMVVSALFCVPEFLTSDFGVFFCFHITASVVPRCECVSACVVCAGVLRRGHLVRVRESWVGWRAQLDPIVTQQKVHTFSKTLQPPEGCPCWSFPLKNILEALL